MRNVFVLAGTLGLVACGGGIDGAVSDAGSHDGNAATSVDSGHALGPDAAGLGDGSAPTSTSDAGADTGSSVDAAGIPEVADCLASPYEMHVVAHGYAGLDGAFGVTGAQGTWSGGVTSESFVQLNINTAQPWVFAAAADFVNGHYLEPGTFTSGSANNRFPYVQIKAAGAGCGAIPTGTFTLLEIGSTGGDEASLTRLLGYFDLTCGDSASGDAGTLRGCVRYEN